MSISPKSRYEYKQVATIAPKTLPYVIENKAKQGWIPVHIQPVHFDHLHILYTVWFKRSKNGLVDQSQELPQR